MALGRVKKRKSRMQVRVSEHYNIMRKVRCRMPMLQDLYSRACAGPDPGFLVSIRIRRSPKINFKACFLLGYRRQEHGVRPCVWTKFLIKREQNFHCFCPWLQVVQTPQVVHTPVLNAAASCYTLPL